jgi:uncharacterized membrane protein
MENIIRVLNKISDKIKQNFIIFVIIILFLAFLIIAGFYIKNSKRFDLNPEDIDFLSKEDLKYIISINKENENINFLLFIAIGIAAFLLALVISYLFFNNKEKNYEKIDKDITLMFLTGKEREFFDIMISKKGECPQFILRQELGLNKVNMTRLVEKLEKKGLIKVYRNAKINVIKLDDKIIENLRKTGLL